MRCGDQPRKLSGENRCLTYVNPLISVRLGFIPVRYLMAGPPAHAAHPIPEPTTYFSEAKDITPQVLPRVGRLRTSYARPSSRQTKKFYCLPYNICVSAACVEQ